MKSFDIEISQFDLLGFGGRCRLMQFTPETPLDYGPQGGKLQKSAFFFSDGIFMSWVLALNL
jgi:hypothetical protein